MSSLQKLMQQVRAISIVNKAFVIALLLRIVYPAIGAARGADLPGYVWIRLLFIVATIVFLILSFPKLMRKVLWRVRHRLLVTWIFVGVVPIVLICMLVAEGLFFLMGQTAGYMTTSEMERQTASFSNTAATLAATLSRGGPPETLATMTEDFVKKTTEARNAEVGAIVRRGTDVIAVPRNGAIKVIPAWLKTDFSGLINDQEDKRYFFATYTTSRAGTGQGIEILVYQPLSLDFFKNLLPGIATVEPNRGTARAGAINVERGEQKKSGFTFKRTGGSAVADPDYKPAPPPAGRGWWDITINWFILLPSNKLSTGDKDATSLAIVTTRPSLVMKKLFSTLGTIGPLFLLFMGVTAALFFVVEIVSVFFSAKLTRSITRAVADLYEGTRKVQAGDFSHRIPLRKNKDQLSELAGSFNSMTERIQDLIVEVKEKERLENELAIARDVQSQLFPKEVPRLKTLELWGACQPARTVSGDYYDFVSLDSGHAALAIGDISGKGISAALLMAHIQSALRSQFMYRISQGNGAATSPANILSNLNSHLYTSSPPEKYATFFLGLYAEENAELIYCNAGHLAPMVVRRGDVLRLPGDGFPVGLLPGVHFEQQAFRLEPGDLLVGFTDGVTETPNSKEEEFGDGRLKELLVRYSEKPLEEIASEISKSVGNWAGNVERHDDTTLLLARRL